MKTKIVAIGNSRGIRIAQTYLQQFRLENSVELEAKNGELVIRPLSKQRMGWKQAFREMTSRGEDRLLHSDLASGSDWDRTEWTW